MSPDDVWQVCYALERQARALNEQADKLHEAHDYNAEFPAADAERMREAIIMLLPNLHPFDRKILLELDRHTGGLYGLDLIKTLRPRWWQSRAAVYLGLMRLEDAKLIRSWVEPQTGRTLYYTAE